MVLKDQILFKGSITELKRKLHVDPNRSFHIEWLNQREFKFLSNFSVGTLIVRNNVFTVDGIKGYAEIVSSKNGITKISLKTKVRIELYLTLGVFLFFFFVSYMSEEKFPPWIYLLLPLSLLWFWFVYRIQEKKLFNRLKEFLKDKTIEAT